MVSIGDENDKLRSRPIQQGGSSAMKKRRRFKQVDSLDKRLRQHATRLRDEARALPSGIEREQPLRLAREVETAARLDQGLALRVAPANVRKTIL
jgi:hypothetical protein